jgi:nucleotide-binding universal stress UspA family protein
MLDVKKILLVIDEPQTSLSVVHQALAVAHHFHSEIVLLHVVSEMSRAASGATDVFGQAGGHLFGDKVSGVQTDLDQYLEPQLESLAVKRLAIKRAKSQAFLQIAQAENVDLIMMSSRGDTFSQFLLEPGIARGTECPIWTSAHTGEPLTEEFAIRNVLCAVDFELRSHHVASWAARMSADVGARLTLANVTASVERWGPGGSYANPELRETLVGDASEHLEKLKRDVGIEADVFIGSGDVPRVLSQAARQTKADLLVNGCYPYLGNLGIHGFAIIRALQIPVLSV